MIRTLRNDILEQRETTTTFDMNADMASSTYNSFISHIKNIQSSLRILTTEAPLNLITEANGKY